MSEGTTRRRSLSMAALAAVAAASGLAGLLVSGPAPHRPGSPSHTLVSAVQETGTRPAVISFGSSPVHTMWVLVKGRWKQVAR